MSITFNLPASVEEHLRGEFVDIDQAAKEAALVELYRQRIITHHEFAIALNVSRVEADALLHRHGVGYDISARDVAGEAASIRPVSDA